MRVLTGLTAPEGVSRGQGAEVGCQSHGISIINEADIISYRTERYSQRGGRLKHERMILVGPGKADGILRTSDRQSRFDHLGSLACDGKRREIDDVQSQTRDAARSALRIDWADPKVISP